MYFLTKPGRGFSNLRFFWGHPRKILTMVKFSIFLKFSQFFYFFENFQIFGFFENFQIFGFFWKFSNFWIFSKFFDFPENFQFFGFFKKHGFCKCQRQSQTLPAGTLSSEIAHWTCTVFMLLVTGGYAYNFYWDMISYD